jgi:hypothetical protein
MAHSVIAGPSQWRLGFDPKLVHVTMVVDKVVRDRFFAKHFGFPLAIAIQSMLHIFIYMLLLSRRTGEAKERWMESAFTSFLNS